MAMLQQAALPRFMADAMLGRLARWLRILGYDTAYEKVITDEALIERALREDRWILTRDRSLTRRTVIRGRHTLIMSDDLEGQLRQLRRDLEIDLQANEPRGHRCAVCNGILLPISPLEAQPLLPAFVAGYYEDFLRCPHCGRVFWPGSHWDHIVKTLTSLQKDTTRHIRKD